MTQKEVKSIAMCNGLIKFECSEKKFRKKGSSVELSIKYSIETINKSRSNLFKFKGLVNLYLLNLDILKGS